MQLYGQVHLLSYLDRMSCRGGSRTAAASKMERFVLIVNGWKPLTIIKKPSILDVAAALDPPLIEVFCTFSPYNAAQNIF